MTFEERFWSKVDKTGECWEWTGGRTAPGWHGRIAVDARRKTVRKVIASRASWEIHFGPIPVGLRVLHACDNAGCVRPDHLMLGTQRANMQDAGRKGRLTHLPTHCKRGHEFVGDNIYIHPSTGRRMCRTCHIQRAVDWRTAHRAAA